MSTDNAIRAKFFLGPARLACGVREGLPGAPQVARPRGLPLVAGLAVARLGEPVRERVLIAEIVGGLGGDDRGPDKAVLLPVLAAVEHPSEDGGRFLEQLRGQVGIGTRRLAGERDDVEATAHGVIDVL